MLNLVVIDFKEWGNETNRSVSYQKAGQVMKKPEYHLKSTKIILRISCLGWRAAFAGYWTRI